MTRVYLKDFDVSMLNQVNSIVTNLSSEMIICNIIR